MLPKSVWCIEILVVCCVMLLHTTVLKETLLCDVVGYKWYIARSCSSLYLCHSLRSYIEGMSSCHFRCQHVTCIREL